MIKTFISDVKLIKNVFKNIYKECIIILVSGFLASVFATLITDTKWFLLLNLISIWAVTLQYKTNFYPFIREVEKEIELQHKYLYLYNKFINGGKE